MQFGKRHLWGLLVVSLALVSGLITFFRRPNRLVPEAVQPAAPAIAVSSERLRELVELANRAVGLLENGELAEADSAFAVLSEELPDETLGPRNLVVTRLMAYRADQSSQAELEESLRLLQRMEEDSSATHWLTAQTARESMNRAVDPEIAEAELQRAVEALQRAIELEPDNVVYHYELFDVTRHAKDPQLKARGREALLSAFRIAPDNLFVLSEALLLQAEQQDPAIIENLLEAEKRIAPLRDSIRRTTRRDVQPLIDKAVAAARSGEWQQVVLNVRLAFFNLVRPHDFAQSDMRRLQPHPLEFVRYQFSTQLQEHLEPQVSPEPLPLEVEFLAVPDAFDTSPPAAPVAVRFADFDLDGRMDLLVLYDDSLRIYLREEEQFVQTIVHEVLAGTVGMLVADLDHDRDHRLADAGGEDSVCFEADVDLVLYGASGIHVLRNDLPENGERQLVDIEQESSLSLRDVGTAVLVDFDHDSDLDLVLATGDGVVPLLATAEMQYADVSEFSQLPPSDLPISGMAIVDWERDVDIDVILTSEEGATVGYLENLRHGNFRWVRFAEEEFDVLRGASSIAVVDSDANTSWDIAGSSPNGTYLVRTVRSPTQRVVAKNREVVAERGGRYLQTWDFDNDGYRDLLSWGSDGLLILRGLPAGNFRPVADDVLFENVPQEVLHADTADWDADGDLDLALALPDGVQLFTNEGGNRNYWLDVRAMGQVDNRGKVNHNGIGSLLEVKSGIRYQAQVVERPVTHFGLGKVEQPDVLRFLWTNGVPQTIVQPAVNQRICEKMVLKGSCPYVYAWNGAEYQFVTDLLWASPIGLQQSEGQLAPWRSWEYLLIREDQLRPRAGRYELQVTEELWEAAYFDEITLLAVDHPADVEVFSNEKVGPAEIANFKVHTVRQRRAPVAARDDQGGDVLAEIAERDEVYFRGFQEQFVPGLVEPHFIELDLGPLDDPEHVTLFLNGWIFPTDTSLNIALSQHPHLQAPRPPAIEVPDADGDWRETIPFTGFPGGKPKTIAIDLSHAFLTDDYRLRITTSAQIYWDQIFFTVDEDPAEVRVQPLQLASAELGYRGFSVPLPPKPNGPELYDFSRVSKALRWPPMGGNFTRYGDVTELLTTTDDRLVVMSAGDAIRLAFAAPAQDLPAGWKRDFLMHNVGWDKDADLNTVVGQTVEPMPYQRMQHYPPLEKRPASEAYDTYLRDYQTRRLKPRHFWQTIAEHESAAQLE